MIVPSPGKVARAFHSSDEKETRVKYPRTFHLPWSEGATDDDKILTTTAHFEGKIVVVTEKMDGENCTIGRNYSHARSTDSANHPSRNWVKQFAAGFQYDIPDGWRLCGENLFAKHSIGYDALPSYFMLFSIWDNTNTCLSWDDTVEYAAMLGVHTVPVLYKGPWDEEKIAALWNGKSSLGGTGEGYVVRTAGSFPYSAFSKNIAKFVRASHVQTDEHWMQKEVVPNKMIKQASKAYRVYFTKGGKEQEYLPRFSSLEGAQKASLALAKRTDLTGVRLETLEDGEPYEEKFYKKASVWREVRDSDDSYMELKLPGMTYILRLEDRELNWSSDDGDFGWVSEADNPREAEQDARAHYLKHLTLKKEQAQEDKQVRTLRQQLQGFADNFRRSGGSPDTLHYRYLIQQAQDLGLIDNSLRLKLNRLSREFKLDSKDDGERMAQGIELILRESKHESLKKASASRIAAPGGPPPTTRDIKEFISKARTWFDLNKMDSTSLRYDTRENGDMENDAPGKQDVLEARRLKKLLLEKYPGYIEVTIEPVDEWTMLEIELVGPNSKLRKASIVGDGTGVGLFFPLPKDLASQFPTKEEDTSPPHVTFLYVGGVPKARQQEFLGVLERAFLDVDKEVSASLDGLDCFVNPPKGKVVFSRIRFSRDLSNLRDRVKASLEEAGFEVGDHFPRYNPHTTIEYLEDLQGVWKGVPPVGSWNFNSVDVWGLPKRYVIPFGEKVSLRDPVPEIGLRRVASLNEKRAQVSRVCARWNGG